MDNLVQSTVDKLRVSSSRGDNRCEQYWHCKFIFISTILRLSVITSNRLGNVWFLVYLCFEYYCFEFSRKTKVEYPPLILSIWHKHHWTHFFQVAGFIVSLLWGIHAQPEGVVGVVMVHGIGALIGKFTNVETSDGRIYWPISLFGIMVMSMDYTKIN